MIQGHVGLNMRERGPSMANHDTGTTESTSRD